MSSESLPHQKLQVPAGYFRSSGAPGELSCTTGLAVSAVGNGWKQGHGARQVLRTPTWRTYLPPDLLPNAAVELTHLRRHPWELKIYPPLCGKTLFNIPGTWLSLGVNNMASFAMSSFYGAPADSSFNFHFFKLIVASATTQKPNPSLTR